MRIVDRIDKKYAGSTIRVKELLKIDHDVLSQLFKEEDWTSKYRLFIPFD